MNLCAILESRDLTIGLEQEVKNFLTTNGIASSRTTPYNSQGNGQEERYNGGRESTVLTRDLVDENRSDPIKIPSPSQENDYTQVFSPSDPVPLQNSPAPTVATPLPQNVTTPQFVTALPPQNVASRHFFQEQATKPLSCEFPS
ncbi:hypothetical protein ILUMI_15763 [Ignelater luminosus]|uniref:Uncharacterized protein n=1 Tax=Ignelater luminosus TaxID=2038154 RepID=A0A8K0CVT6_IGNLU|nr:hypothetical protein ILUMI_15763 [Ignelater luminosus]